MSSWGKKIWLFMHPRNCGSDLKSCHRTSDQGNPLTFVRLASDRPPAALQPPARPSAPQACQYKIAQSKIWQPKCNSRFFGREIARPTASCVDCKTVGFFLKISKESVKRGVRVLLLARTWIRKNTDCFAAYVLWSKDKDKMKSGNCFYIRVV